MKLANKKVAVLLSEDGKQILQLARIGLPETDIPLVVVHETEDLGLWIRIERGAEDRLFLLRWEYILGIDLPDETTGNLIGLKR